MNNFRFLPETDTSSEIYETNGRLLTIKEAAQALYVSERTLWRMIKAGDIRVVKIRNCKRIDPADIQHYVKNHKSRGI